MAIFEQNILEELGTPPGFLQIDAKPLWDNRYRVNIWVEYEDKIYQVVRKQISDSFFVVTSDGGEIIRSSPEIKRKYDG